MSTVYLSNPVVVINSVDLTGQCTSATLNYVYEQLESTAFGMNARRFGNCNAGTPISLQNNTLEVTLYQSYEAASTESTIYGLVGIQTNLVLQAFDAATSATNPEYTLTGAYLESHTPINATLGELSTITLTFAGGELTKAVS